MIYKTFLKRPIDFLLAFMAIIVLFPVLLITTVLVKTKIGSPVIFKQKRPGLNEKIFTMYKFRTMTDNKDENGRLLPDTVRLTQFGKMLRATSLDELPELFNIIKGEMSFVGPRPQLVRDMMFMTSEQRKRHSLLPGLTGWAQIKGRNNIAWEEKLSLDLEYVEDISFLKDLKIMLRTVDKVFMKDDISTAGMDTAEDFGDYLLRIGKIEIDEYNNLLDDANKYISLEENT